MKKLLLTSALATGLAFSAAADPLTYTSVTTEGSRDAVWSASGYNGFTFILDPTVTGTRLETTNADSLATQTTVKLTSITTTELKLSVLTDTQTIKLAQTDQNGTILAISDNSITTGEDGDVAWTFADVTIGTSAAVYFVYFDANTAAVGTQIKVGDTLTTAQMANMKGSFTAGLASGSGSATLSMVKGSSSGLIANVPSYAPKLTIETEQIISGDPGGEGNVPEPTTATLSLLALAGLAARRRRK